MIFTFMQMYYLFMHSRLNINKNKIMAKFGLMHLLVKRNIAQRDLKLIFLRQPTAAFGSALLSGELEGK